jgi:hypothetical protein
MFLSMIVGGLKRTPNDRKSSMGNTCTELPHTHGQQHHARKITCTSWTYTQLIVLVF